MINLSPTWTIFSQPNARFSGFSRVLMPSQLRSRHGLTTHTAHYYYVVKGKRKLEECVLYAPNILLCSLFHYTFTYLFVEFTAFLASLLFFRAVSRPISFAYNFVDVVWFATIRKRFELSNKIKVGESVNLFYCYYQKNFLA